MNITVTNYVEILFTIVFSRLTPCVEEGTEVYRCGFRRKDKLQIKYPAFVR